MMMERSTKQVIDYAVSVNDSVLQENPGVLNDGEGFLVHIRGVANNAEEAARKIKENYSWLPLDVDETVMAAGLHDIGRSLNPKELGQLGHEIGSGRWIEKDGLEKEIVKTLKDAYRIAQMARSHASIFEQWKVAEEIDKTRYNALVKNFGNINPDLLKARTWQEGIVTYSDLRDKNGKRVDPIWKLQEAMKRYSQDENIKDEVVVQAHKRAMPRLIYLCKAIDAATKGTLSRTEIKTLFGFL